MIDLFYGALIAFGVGSISFIMGYFYGHDAGYKIARVYRKMEEEEEEEEK